MKRKIVECLKCLGYILVTFVFILLTGRISFMFFDFIENIFGFWGVPMFLTIYMSIVIGVGVYKLNKINK